MRAQVLLALTALLVPSVVAVFADDAYQIDYHHASLGLPQQHTTFFQQPYTGSKASLLYTLSEKHVLGAVNPKDGAIVWRQLLRNTANATEGLLRAGEGQDVVVSAVGNQVAAWSASDGRLAWSNSLDAEHVRDLEILEQEGSSADNGSKDVLFLSGDSVPTVRRLDGKTGDIKWSFEDTRYLPSGSD